MTIDGNCGNDPTMKLYAAYALAYSMDKNEARVHSDAQGIYSNVGALGQEALATKETAPAAATSSKFTITKAKVAVLSGVVAIAATEYMSPGTVTTVAIKSVGLLVWSAGKLAGLAMGMLTSAPQPEVKAVGFMCKNFGMSC